jgi:hypothetical protein
VVPSLREFPRRYAVDVERQLADAAGMLAFVFEGLDEAQWAKRRIYGYPTPAERTLSWVAQQTLHELDHHLGDLQGVARRGLTRSDDGW